MRSFSRGKLALAGAVLLLGSACASAPSPTGMDLGNNRDLDLSQYDRVMIEPVSVAFDKDWAPTVVGSHLELSMQERRRLEANVANMFDKSFPAELSKGEALELVDDARPGTVRIVPELIDVSLAAPAPLLQPGLTYVRSVGTVTLHVTFFDAVTGEQLLELHDQVRGRDIGLLRTASPVYNEHELTRIFEDWAQVIRQDILRAP